MLTRQRLDTGLIQDADQPLQNEDKVTLEQAHWNGGGDGREDTKSGCVGDGLVAALLLLLGLPSCLIPSAGLLGMMYRAIHVCAYLVDGANITALGDDGFAGELAFFELRTLGIVLRLRAVVPNGGVLVARQDGASFRLHPVGGADLDQLRFRGDGLRDVRVYLRLIAGWVGALVTLLAKVIPKQQLVVACALRAIGAIASGRHKLGVPLVEGGILEDEENIGRNPELEIADGQKNSRWLVSVGVDLFEASLERLFLLIDWQLRQQQRMPYPDAIGIERLNRCGCKVALSLRRCATKAGVFPTLAAICSMLYLGSSKSSKARKPCASSIG